MGHQISPLAIQYSSPRSLLILCFPNPARSLINHIAGQSVRLTTDFLIAAIIIDTPGAGITADAGTRLDLQLLARSLHVLRYTRLLTIAPRRASIIFAPAADLGPGSRLSGSLSGIKPSFPVPVFV